MNVQHDIRGCHGHHMSLYPLVTSTVAREGWPSYHQLENTIAYCPLAFQAMVATCLRGWDQIHWWNALKFARHTLVHTIIAIPILSKGSLFPPCGAKASDMATNSKPIQYINALSTGYKCGLKEILAVMGCNMIFSTWMSENKKDASRVYIGLSFHEFPVYTINVQKW